MAISPVIDIQSAVPLDARRISSRRLVGGGSDAAPVPATTVGVFNVEKYISLILKIYADITTGAGETVDIAIWRYARLMEQEPTTGNTDTPGWSECDSFNTVALGYAEGNKEFLVPTLDCEQMFVQVKSVPGGLAWMWVEVIVDIPRYNSMPILGNVRSYQ